MGSWTLNSLAQSPTSVGLHQGFESDAPYLHFTRYCANLDLISSAFEHCNPRFIIVDLVLRLSSCIPCSLAGLPMAQRRSSFIFPVGDRRAFCLYRQLTRHRTYLMIQLRTGHSWLAPHSRRFKFTDDDRYVCGAIETVVHVLVDCPRLWVARQELRSQVGDALGCVATMLGGIPRNEQGKASKGGVKWKIVNALLDFAEASGRFKVILDRD